MKVVENKKLPQRGKSKTCYNCKSKLRYINSDVHMDRDGKYIICPVCTKLIAVS